MIAQKGAFTPDSALWRVGVSTAEIPSKILMDRRIYVFHYGSWNQKTYLDFKKIVGM
jgi:hypothetical protein